MAMGKPITFRDDVGGEDDTSELLRRAKAFTAIPTFSAGRCIVLAISDPYAVVTDDDGKPWHMDVRTGEISPVKVTARNP